VVEHRRDLYPWLVNHNHESGTLLAGGGGHGAHAQLGVSGRQPARGFVRENDLRSPDEPASF
jgi:hypothetical protein